MVWRLSEGAERTFVVSCGDGEGRSLSASVALPLSDARLSLKAQIDDCLTCRYTAS